MASRVLTNIFEISHILDGQWLRISSKDWLLIGLTVTRYVVALEKSANSVLLSVNDELYIFDGAICISALCIRINESDHDCLVHSLLFIIFIF